MAIPVTRRAYLWQVRTSDTSAGGSIVWLSPLWHSCSRLPHYCRAPRLLARAIASVDSDTKEKTRDVGPESLLTVVCTVAGAAMPSIGIAQLPAAYCVPHTRSCVLTLYNSTRACHTKSQDLAERNGMPLQLAVTRGYFSIPCIGVTVA